MVKGMVRSLEPGGRARGEGISEVIGFLLILAVIIASVSLYFVFLMPAMGREEEIARMSDVKEAFTEYKLNIDTLWTSRQCTSDFGPALSIGSGEKAGILSYFSFFRPPKAGAVLALNQRAENITITMDSYYTVGSGGYSETGTLTGTPVAVKVNATAVHYYINISTTDLLTERGIFIDGPGWDVLVNVTPNYYYTNRFNITRDQWGYISNFWNWTEYTWNSTDVTVTTLSGGTVVGSIPVYRDIGTSTGYRVDLMSPVYGVSTRFQNPQTVSMSLSDSSGQVSGTYDIREGFVPAVTTSTSSLGSIEFRSNNLWYTPQTYYYQLGGVFLEQQDGSTSEIPPSIRISLVNGSPVVNVGEILIRGGVTSTEVSGSGPITVASAVTDATATLLAPGNNTRWVNLTIQAASVNASQMWQQTLTTIADRGGLPASAYTNGTSGNYAFINITGSPDLYDVRLSLTQVNVSADYVMEYSPGEVSRYWRDVPGFSLPTETTPTVTPTTPTPTVTPTATPTPGPSGWYNCDWNYRKNITLNKAKVNGTLSDFPALINLASDSDLQANAQASGKDIFFTSGGTKLSHEIETYNSGTGALVAWVKVSSLPSSENTTIFMYYGNSTASSQENKNDVWSGGYAAVWHLNETGTGASKEYLDSTSNTNHGQGGNGVGSAPVRAAAKIGYGQDFTPGSNQFIGVPDKASLQIDGPITTEAWVYGHTWANTDGSSYRAVFSRQYGFPGYAYGLSVFACGAAPSSCTPNGFIGSNSVSGGTVGTNSWNHLVTNYTGSGGSPAPAYLFINGEYVTTQAGLAILIDANPVIIGGKEFDATSQPNQLFDGVIDEVRISNVARSPGWIWTEYQNQNSPSTFHYLNASETSPC